MTQPETTPAADRLVRRTSRSLALVTMALIGLLLTGVGVVTAVMVLQTTDQGIDRSLESAADARLVELQVQANQLNPEPTDSPDPTDDGGGGDNSGSGSDDCDSDNSGSGSDNSGPGSDNSGPGSGNSGSGSDDCEENETPPPSPTPSPSPTPGPSATPGFGLPTDGQTPQNADTFFLLLDPKGGLSPARNGFR